MKVLKNRKNVLNHAGPYTDKFCLFSTVMFGNITIRLIEISTDTDKYDERYAVLELKWETKDVSWPNLNTTHISIKGRRIDIKLHKVSSFIFSFDYFFVCNILGVTLTLFSRLKAE